MAAVGARIEGLNVICNFESITILIDLADGRKNNKGIPGVSGRKPKADEQKLIEKLTPMEHKAHAALKQALEEGKPWAVKLFFEYLYGKPRQSVDVTSEGAGIVVPEIKWRTPPK